MRTGTNAEATVPQGPFHDTTGQRLFAGQFFHTTKHAEKFTAIEHSGVSFDIGDHARIRDIGSVSSKFLASTALHRFIIFNAFDLNLFYSRFPFGRRNMTT